MTHRGVDYVESALQNILRKLECEKSEDKLCNLRKAFVDVAVKSDRPQLLLGGMPFTKNVITKLQYSVNYAKRVV